MKRAHKQPPEKPQNQDGGAGDSVSTVHGPQSPRISNLEGKTWRNGGISKAQLLFCWYSVLYLRCCLQRNRNICWFGEELDREANVSRRLPRWMQSSGYRYFLKRALFIKYTPYPLCVCFVSFAPVCWYTEHLAHHSCGSFLRHVSSLIFVEAWIEETVALFLFFKCDKRVF